MSCWEGGFRPKAVVNGDDRAARFLGEQSALLVVGFKITYHPAPTVHVDEARRACFIMVLVNTDRDVGICRSDDGVFHRLKLGPGP